MTSTRTFFFLGPPSAPAFLKRFQTDDHLNQRKQQLRGKVLTSQHPQKNQSASPGYYKSYRDQMTVWQNKPSLLAHHCLRRHLNVKPGDISVTASGSELQNFSLTYNQQRIILDINHKYVARAASSDGHKTLDFAKRLI